ncbi:MAG: MBL fold metallo-hydrolase [Muribaculaceae bacterium]|nr:MBL fold metallo-hydrolase [Muribaculaceae bacterium]
MARIKKITFDTRYLPGLFDELLPEEEQDASAEPVRKTGSNRGRPRKSSEHGLSGGEYETAIPLPDGIEPLTSTVPAKTLRFISFGSGSSGNCSYLGNDRFGILIDAGVDPSKIYAELDRNGIDIRTIGGIILTHDHGDHVRYAYTIVRRNRHIRIYCTPATLNGMLRRHNISRRIKDYHQPVFKEFPFHLSDFAITPFEVSHDGSDNVGFFISAGDHRFVVATDMGVVTERADFYIRQANHLMIEANYDRNMLLNGRYPEYLKARIMAARGHMDNEATASYLKEIYSPSLLNIFLCHLSNDNNTPETALTAVDTALRDIGIEAGDGSGSIESRNAPVQVSALPRFDSTGVIVLRLT